MKRQYFLISLIVSLFMFSHAQVPQSLRVLNYVPDECYSVSVMHLDSIAKNCELQALDKDHVLNVFYKKSKFVKSFVKSWINKDDKLGVDFTSAMAYCNSNLIMIPLNDEKKFEKLLSDIVKTKLPFESIGVGGIPVRYFTYEESEVMSVHLFCTDDMAFAFLYVANSNVEKVPSREIVIQQCSELFHSKFLQSVEGKYFVDNKMSSYVYYSPESPYTKQILNTVTAKLGAKEAKDALNQMNIKTFTRGEVRKNKMTSVMQIFEGEGPLISKGIGEDQMRSDQLEKLLPYAGSAPLAIMTCNVQGIGEMMSPVMSAFPSFKPLVDFVNNPFLIRYNADNVLFVSMVDQEQDVRKSLDKYVKEFNWTKDSTYKAAKEMYEKYAKQLNGESEESEEENEEEINYFMMGMLYATMGSDSLSGRKSLMHENMDGWDVYTILTSKRSYEEEVVVEEVLEEGAEPKEKEEQEPVLAYDSAYVLVHDGMLFFTNSKDAFDDIRKPSGKPQNVPVDEMLSRPVYATADLATLVAMSGVRVDIPFSDLVIYDEGNTVVTTFNAVRGLKHGMFYEIVKIVSDLMRK